MRLRETMPPIGFGTWKILEQNVADIAVETAVNSGYRLFDTAKAYENEKIIGKAIRNAGISREELWISGKVWNSDRGYEQTLKAYAETCKELKTDYLDSYLIHWPASLAIHEDAEKIDAETWKAMEKLYTDGCVGTIGVCNFRIHHIENLKKTANMLPMINQIEYHPGCRQSEVVNYCINNEIIVQGWSPLGSGKMMKKPVLKEMAGKYGKTVAQICLRWELQNKIIPLPKSVTPERINSNIAIFDFEITESDMQILDTLPWMGGLGWNPDEITIFG